MHTGPLAGFGLEIPCHWEWNLLQSDQLNDKMS